MNIDANPIVEEQAGDVEVNLSVNGKSSQKTDLSGSQQRKSAGTDSQETEKCMEEAQLNKENIQPEQLNKIVEEKSAEKILQVSKGIFTTPRRETRLRTRKNQTSPSEIQVIEEDLGTSISIALDEDSGVQKKAQRGRKPKISQLRSSQSPPEKVLKQIEKQPQKKADPCQKKLTSLFQPVEQEVVEPVKTEDIDTEIAANFKGFNETQVEEQVPQVTLFNSMDEVFLSYIGNWRKIKKSSYSQADQDLWKCRECSFRLLITKDLKNDNRLEAKI